MMPQLLNATQPLIDKQICHLPIINLRALNNYYYLSFRPQGEILTDVNH